MKNTFLFILGILVVQIAGAQELERMSYSDHFREAKLLIANHKEEEAIPVLESLLARDKENSNVSYMLGLCYVKSFKKINKAIDLLENAKDDYSKFYDRTSVSERGVSEYVYYYLIIAYSLKGDCPNTISTLNEFYKVYSYEDEWYLVDGQKWYRDCGKHKWKEEQDSVVSPPGTDSTLVEAMLNADTAQASEGEQEVQELTLLDPVEAAESSMAKGASQAPLRPYRERLRRVGEAGGPEVMTREVSYTTPLALYGVQVGAYIKPRYSNDFKNLKNVEVYIDNNGVFRYVIGRFAYKSQAEKLLAYVKDVGYNDAFLVDINGGTENYSEEVIRVNYTSIKREISGKVEYKVQIGAFKEDIPDDIMKIFLQFDNIDERIQGELTIFTLGEFSSYEIAKVWCDNVKESGVPDAFVVAYNEGHKISLEEANTYVKEKQAEEAAKARTAEEEKRKKKKKK